VFFHVKEITVADSILDEDLITLAEAARLLPRRPCRTSLWRWHKFGARGVRLETVLIGGIRHTSRQALTRFIAAVSEATDGAPVRSHLHRKRRRRFKHAEAILDAAGIGVSRPSSKQSQKEGGVGNFAGAATPEIKEETGRLTWDWDKQQFVIDGAVVGEFPQKLIASTGWGQDEFQRNARIYEQCMQGVPFQAIISGLKRQPQKWGLIDSRQGIKAAAVRFAKRLGLPHPPSRKPGRIPKAD
jgi:hypothetical protein